MARTPEHWEDQAPNEPEPQTFARETPTVVWWVIGVLAALAVIAVAVIIAVGM